MRTLIAVLLVALLAGCTTTQRSASESRLITAQARAEKGEKLDALVSLRADMRKPNDDGRAVQEFARSTTKTLDVVTAFAQDSNGSPSAYRLSQLLETADALHAVGAITHDEHDAVRKYIGESAKKLILAGDSNAVVNDDLLELPEVKTNEVGDKIFELTLDKARFSSEATDKVLDMAEQAGRGSSRYEAVRSQIGSLVLARGSLAKVAELFPAETEQLLDESEVKLFVESSDRLLKEDVSESLGRKPYITVLDDVDEAEVVLNVEKLAWDERPPSSSTQTVQYADYQVNLIGAVFFMPKNASYVYEMTEGNVSLEYAFELIGKEQPSENEFVNTLVRGQATRYWRECSNARIVNVFGGSQPANFLANDDMKVKCTNSAAPATATDLRRAAYRELIEKIDSLPPFRKARSAVN